MNSSSDFLLGLLVGSMFPRFFFEESLPIFLPFPAHEPGVSVSLRGARDPGHPLPTPVVRSGGPAAAPRGAPAHALCPRRLRVAHVPPPGRDRVRAGLRALRTDEVSSAAVLERLCVLLLLLMLVKKRRERNGTRKCIPFSWLVQSGRDIYKSLLAPSQAQILKMFSHFPAHGMQKMHFLPLLSPTLLRPIASLAKTQPEYKKKSRIFGPRWKGHSCAQKPSFLN